MRGGVGQLDDVIVGERAEAWTKAIGQHGDSIRMILINELVASLLNHFAGLDGQERIAKPHSLIQKWLAALPIADNENFDELLAKLEAQHLDTPSLNSRFPNLTGSTLLDLGCGTGYLGGWLSTAGVRYVGVEPSCDLINAARSDDRLNASNLHETTMQRFFEEQQYPLEAPPSLISMVGMLDQVADPESALCILSNFLAAKKWQNVPILVATFDPDFFASTLPDRFLEEMGSAFYEYNETLAIRDPAQWEEMFSQCGYHILEQRPIHISGLPTPLANHVQDMHLRQFRYAPIRVPPRQGPFYLWLICPRMMTRSAFESTEDGADQHLEIYYQAEELAIIGNMGSRVYRVIEGSAFFDSPHTGKMPFGQSSFFGQQEASCNYVSSRIFGSLKSADNTKLCVTESRQVLKRLYESSNYSDRLFLSLLHHLDSIQFRPFINVKRKKNKSKIEKEFEYSSVLFGASYEKQDVTNFAASILQVCANKLNLRPIDYFKSRIVVDFDHAKICRYVYGQNWKREGSDLWPIISTLVQSNVIDCFSSYAVEACGAEDNIESFDEEDKEASESLNIAWQAACFLEGIFARTSESFDKYNLFVAIAAFLSSDSAKQTLKVSHDDLKIGNDDDEDHPMYVRPISERLPRTANELRSKITNLLSISDDKTQNTELFLELLWNGFRYKKSGHFYNKYGLNNIMIIRDVPALMACLLNREDIWHSDLKLRPCAAYISQGQQRPRIIAYHQECISELGRLAGLA
jgi:SAM-dependent methyltransferase